MTSVAPISSQNVPQVRLMCLATHHKGGTVWMKQIIKALAVECNIPWIGIWSDAQVQNIPEAGPTFLVNWHGWFPSSVWDRDDIAVLHIIRDPRVNSCAVARKAARGGAAFVPKTTRDCNAVYHAKTADYAARRRQPGAQGWGLLGGLAKALVKGASESVVANAYRQCLRDIGAPVTAGIPKTSESISVAPTLNQPSARADISTTPTATICTGNLAIMVGGSDYCPR